MSPEVCSECLAGYFYAPLPVGDCLHRFVLDAGAASCDSSGLITSCGGDSIHNKLQCVPNYDCALDGGV